MYMEPTPIEQQPAVSPWGAVLRVFTNPSAALGAIADRPAIAPAYLVHMGLGTVMAILMGPALSAATRETYLSKPETAAQADFGGVVAVIGLYFGALVAPWLVGLCVALIGLLAGAITGGNGKFNQYFAMAGYARLVLMVGSVAMLPLTMQARTQAQLKAINFSLAALLPDSASPILHAALSTINPFDLWYYVLLAIGFAAINRTSRRKGAMLPGLLYTISLLLTVAGAAVASTLTTLQPPR